MICQYWCFKNIGYKFKPYVCSKRHDISMMVYELESIAILNIKGVVYRFGLWYMTKNVAINRLNNSKLDDKGTL